MAVGPLHDAVQIRAPRLQIQVDADLTPGLRLRIDAAGQDTVVQSVDPGTGLELDGARPRGDREIQVDQAAWDLQREWIDRQATIPQRGRQRSSSLMILA
jgi:hypothetical protein